MLVILRLTLCIWSWGLVGVGTIVHSCVDMVLSIAVWKVLIKNRSIAAVANVKEADLKFGKEKALQTTSKA